jgi:hypothetical protein
MTEQRNSRKIKLTDTDFLNVYREVVNREGHRDDSRLTTEARNVLRRAAAVRFFMRDAIKRHHVPMQCEMSLECPFCGDSCMVSPSDDGWIAVGAMAVGQCSRGGT